MRQATTAKRTVIQTNTPKNRIETPWSETTSPQKDFYQKVQEKAYELYEARGSVHGYDIDDWLTAEQIVKAS